MGTSVHAPGNARADSVDGEDELERFERELLPLMDDAYTLARHLTRDPHDAQDMVQEAYLRALRYFATYLGGDARAWFLTIVRHCCFTLHRRRQTAAELDLDAVPGEVEAPPAYAADDRALARDRRETIDRALATLPPVFREAIVLRDVHGLSYREIARIAGVPVGTVMSRLARARKRAQEALGWASREAS
jgi:RNA polymerase sigma-70 factor (ECF subfamily)